MKVVVYGAGAIGGHLAVRLGQLADVELAVIARGPHLAAIRQHGLALHTSGERLHCRPRATATPDELPVQDLVFVTLKSPAIPPAAAGIARLLGPESRAVFLVNGYPWWMAGSSGPLDPEGQLAALVGYARTLGGIVYSSNAVTAPGIITHSGHDDWAIAAATPGRQGEADAVAALLRRAGLSATRADDFPLRMWSKLMLNGSGNPVAALTRLPVPQCASGPGLAALTLALRREIAAVAASTGVDLSGSPWLASLDDLAGLPPIKPSMLQDVEASRPMEVEALLGQVVALARAGALATPALDAVLPLLRGLDRAIAVGQGHAPESAG